MSEFKFIVSHDVKTLRHNTGPYRFVNGKPYVLIAAGSPRDLKEVLLFFQEHYDSYRIVPIGSGWNRENPYATHKLYVHPGNRETKDAAWSLITALRNSDIEEVDVNEQ